MFNRFLSGPLFAEETGESGAGAGDNSGAAKGTDAKGAQTPDLDTFRKSILDEVNKTFNGFAKNLKNDFAKLQQTTTAAAKTETTQEAEQETATAGGKADKANPEVAILTRELKKLQDLTTSLQEENKRTKESAAKKEADSLLRGELSKHQLVPGASEDLFEVLSGKIKRDDNGRLFAGDDVNLDVFVKDYIESRPHYLPPVNVNGAGSGRSQQAHAKALDWDQVGPGASKETLDRARAELAALITAKH
jgi:hypothetical protein